MLVSAETPLSPGELIPLRCDSVVCPTPHVDDCYMHDDVCAADEWCRLEDHMKFGPFAMAHGETPNNIAMEVMSRPANCARS